MTQRGVGTVYRRESGRSGNFISKRERIEAFLQTNDCAKVHAIHSDSARDGNEIGKSARL